MWLSLIRNYYELLTEGCKGQRLTQASLCYRLEFIVSKGSCAVRSQWIFYFFLLLAVCFIHAPKQMAKLARKLFVL